MYTSKNFPKWNNYLKDLYNEIFGKDFIDDCITCLDGEKSLDQLRKVMTLAEQDKIIMFDDRHSVNVEGLEN